MSQSTAETTRPHTPFQGSQILDRLIRTLHAATVTGIIYGLLAKSMATACAGSGDCATLTMQPSSWVYLVMALVAIALLSSIFRHAGTEAEASQQIRKAGIAVALIPVAALIAAYVSFFVLNGQIENLANGPLLGIGATFTVE